MTRPTLLRTCYAVRLDCIDATRRLLKLVALSNEHLQQDVTIVAMYWSAIWMLGFVIVDARIQLSRMPLTINSRCLLTNLTHFAFRCVYHDMVHHCSTNIFLCAVFLQLLIS